jgi:hypothetical protein
MENQPTEQVNHIELPHHYKQLPDRLRLALGEFYDNSKNKQWFRRAEIVQQHPMHMKNTLEIYCEYAPVLEMKEILQFTAKYDLALEIVARSNQG